MDTDTRLSKTNSVLSIDAKGQSSIPNITDYLMKYDGSKETHNFGYIVIKLPKAIQEAFPCWIIFGNKYAVDQTKQLIREEDMKLHSSYSLEQHKKSMFGQLLANKTRVIIVRDAKEEYDTILQIYEPSCGATSIVYLLHRITQYGLDGSKYYHLQQI